MNKESATKPLDIPEIPDVPAPPGGDIPLPPPGMGGPDGGPGAPPPMPPLPGIGGGLKQKRKIETKYRLPALNWQALRIQSSLRFILLRPYVYLKRLFFYKMSPYKTGPPQK